MATTTKKTYTPNEQLPESVAGPIQQSISRIQEGINSLKSGGGSNLSDSTGTSTGPKGEQLYVNPDTGKLSPNLQRYVSGNQTDITHPSPETAQISPTEQAPQALVDQTQQAQQQINQLAQQRGTTLTPDGRGGYTATPNAYKEQYRQGFEIAKQVGGDALQDVGGGVATTQAIMSAVPNKQPQISPEVDSFYLEDKNVTAQAQEIIDFLSPPSTQQMLIDGMKQVQSQQAQLSQDKFALMNLETIMSGSVEDIAKEIEASGGIGTQSLVTSLAVARNSTLLKQASFLQNKIAMQQDLIQNSTQLLSFEKEMANTQFSQRLGVMQYVQQNNDRMMNAFRDSVDTIQKTTGWAGLKAAYTSNPRQLGYVESLYGGTGSLDRLAAEEKRQASIVTPEQALRLENLKLQNQKLRQEVDDAGSNTVSAGGSIPNSLMAKVSEGERLGYGFLNRAINAQSAIDSLESKKDIGGKGYEASGFLTNAYNTLVGANIPFTEIRPGKAVGLQTSNYESYRQAAGDFIKAVLRKESGATIPPEEEVSYFKTFFPTTGEGKAVIEQKRQSREKAIGLLKASAGRLAPYSETNQFQEYVNLLQTATLEQLEEAGIK